MYSYRVLTCLGLCAITIPHRIAAQGDPPTRVGRVSDMTGAVSLYPAGARDWTDASLNYPLTTGDALWTDTGARAELHLGSSAIRIGQLTALTFGEVSDTVTQVRLDQGSIDVHVRFLSEGEVYEIDTPSGVVSLLYEGHYRIDVTADGRRTTATVRDGQAEVLSGDRSYEIEAGTSADLLDSPNGPTVSDAIPVDEWERWADDRDRREDAVQSTRYVSRDMVGYDDLDNYGVWQTDPTYGPVWTPRNVQQDWAPYRYGHWESVRPWGWTWIDDEPWGFAPFHYGRWAYLRGRWAWVPGSIRERPAYAPALVAFIGEPDWNASAAFGGGAGVAWVPLAPGEQYVPGYQASPAYVKRVNLFGLNLRIDLGGGSMAQDRYRNREIPGGVTAVPRDAFERSRPVAAARVTLRPADVAAARPSPIPVAGNQRLPAPPPDQLPDRGRRPAPRPSGLEPGQVKPPPVAEPLRNRPRPGGQAPRREVRPGQPPAAIAPPPPPAPAPVPPAPPPVRDRRPPPPPPLPPAQPPASPAPAPPAPLPPAPPPVRDRRPPAPPPAPTPPPAAPAPVPPAPPPAPPVRDRRPPAPPPAPTPPPAAPAPVPPAPPPAPPVRDRRSPPPAPPAQPAVVPPPAPNGPPGREGRGRPAGPQANTAEWQAQRNQLIARQQKETADLATKHQAQLKQLSPDAPATQKEQLQKVQQEEIRALEVRQQQERDQLDKRYRKPGG